MKQLNEVAAEERKLERAEQGAYDYDLHTEFLQLEKEKRLESFAKLSGNQKIVYDPTIVHKFIGTINGIARRNGLFDKLPKEPFPSILHFASHMTQFFLDNKVPMEEISKIDAIVIELESNKVNQ